MCDCCESTHGPMKVYPTEDDDCVMLCEECVADLAAMGSALDGIFG